VCGGAVWRGSSRLAGLLQLLDKLAVTSLPAAGAQHDVSATSSSASSLPLARAAPLSQHGAPRYSADDLQQLRYLTSKILQHVNSQGTRRHAADVAHRLYVLLLFLIYLFIF